MTFEEFVLGAREKGASDIHLTVGAPTVIRVNGLLEPYGDLDDLTVNRAILSLLTPEQQRVLSEGHDIDFSFELSNGARQRVNVFRQNGKLACSIRLLNTYIPSFEELKLPPVIKKLAEKKRGLILVTGPTGSGKSTTLSAMLDHINHTKAVHIISIEDPIEYRYEPALATIHQRELGRDTQDFVSALRSALREDPDIILVGELRDFETIRLAILAAETGHLVLGPLHKSSAALTIDRIVDACPESVQEQIRASFANQVAGIISQNLVPKADGSGRLAALEIMIGTDAVRNLIKTGKLAQLESTIQAGSREGMCTMNDALARYYRRDLITYETAMDYCTDREEMEKALNAAKGF